MPISVFNSRSGNWRTVFLRTEADARRLNRLFRSGWHLIDLGLPELSSFAFYVPTEELRSLPLKPALVLGARPAPKGETLMLILHRGRGKHEQQALLIRPDAGGYVELNVVSERLREQGWDERRSVIQVFRMENGFVLVIVSGPRSGGEEAS